MNAEKIKELRGLVAAAVGFGNPHLRMQTEDAVALLDEVEALTADAERYRWLRDANNADPTPFIAQRYEYGIMQWTGEKADAAIDAARHEPKDSP